MLARSTVGSSASGEDNSEGSRHIQSDYESDTEYSEKGGEDSGAQSPMFAPTTSVHIHPDVEPSVSKVHQRFQYTYPPFTWVSQYLASKSLTYYLCVDILREMELLG